MGNTSRGDTGRNIEDREEEGEQSLSEVSAILMGFCDLR